MKTVVGLNNAYCTRYSLYAFPCVFIVLVLVFSSNDAVSLHRVALRVSQTVLSSSRSWWKNLSLMTYKYSYIVLVCPVTAVHTGCMPQSSWHFADETFHHRRRITLFCGLVFFILWWQRRKKLLRFFSSSENVVHVSEPLVRALGTQVW